MSGSRKTKDSDPSPPVGTDERRGVCRYSVVLNNSWLGWWEGQDFRTTPSTIIDISLRGAFLTVDAFPPKTLQSVWFCPPGVTDQEEWVEARTISCKKRLFGSREVRVSFRKVFPYELFKTVVYGPGSFQPAARAAEWVPNETEDRDLW